MASAGKPALDDSRRATGSPKLKGRGRLTPTVRHGTANARPSGTCWSRAVADDSSENAKDTLCRNVTIYGRCRYEDKGIYLAAIPLLSITYLWDI